MARQKWKEWAENHENQSVLTAWARAGMTDEQIAGRIGISRSTLSEWKGKYEGIAKALRGGKDFANRLVEDALFRAALGGEVTVKKAVKVKVVEYDRMSGKRIGEREEIVAAEETEYIKPDVKAIEFWLRNRAKNEWAEREEEVEEAKGMIIMTDEQATQVKEIMEEERKKANGQQREE